MCDEQPAISTIYIYIFPDTWKKKLTKMAYLAVFKNIEMYVLFVFLQNMNNTEKTFFWHSLSYVKGKYYIDVKLPFLRVYTREIFTAEVESKSLLAPPH